MASKRIEDWTPEIVRADGPIYATMLVQAERCAACERVMVSDRTPVAKTAPVYQAVSFDAQRKRAGWVLLSGSTRDGKSICKDCQTAGKGGHVCSLCHETRSGEPVEWWDGDSLCAVCYETVPAKVWREKERELEEAHRYDHC